MEKEHLYPKKENYLQEANPNFHTPLILTTRMFDAIRVYIHSSGQWGRGKHY